MGRTTNPTERIGFALIAVGAVALAALSMGLLDAGFIDALGTVARTVAGWFGAGKDTAKAVEIGAEAVGRIVDLLFF